MDVVVYALVVAVGFLLATLAGTPVVKALIRHIDRSAAVDREPRDGPQIDTQLLGLEDAAASMPGGKWIGLLERAAVYVCVLVGSASALAVVLAIKALGRYADLRTPNEARGERFIIGTLSSMLWATAMAGLVLLGRWGVTQLW